MSDRRRKHDLRVPAERERFALELLERALVLIKKLEKLSKPRAISELGFVRDPLINFEYLISQFERRPRPGPRPRHKRSRPVAKRGAPRKWTPTGWRDLLDMIEAGRASLRKKGVARIADVEALTEGLRLAWVSYKRPFSEHELKRFVESLRRRIPEARKMIGAEKATLIRR